MKLHLLLLPLMALFAIKAQGQANYYSFQKHSVAYSELTNDTTIANAKFGTGEIFDFKLAGEAFSFFGKNYMVNDTTVTISFSNSGHMKVENDSTFIIVDGLFYYLDSIDGNSRLSYKIEGTGNNKILKVQWKNLKIKSGQPGNYVNFQMWLHQSSGIFDIYYGPSSANNQSGYTNQTGPNVGMFYSLKDFSKMFEKLWVNGTPPNYTFDSTKNAAFNALKGVPENGTMFRFIPKTVLNIEPVGVTKTGFELYPNPANTKVMIRNTATTAASILITDATGRSVGIYEMKQQSMEVDTKQLPAGNYLVTIKTPGTTYTYKLVINH